MFFPLYTIGKDITVICILFDQTSRFSMQSCMVSVLLWCALLCSFVPCMSYIYIFFHKFLFEFLFYKFSLLQSTVCFAFVTLVLWCDSQTGCSFEHIICFRRINPFDESAASIKSDNMSGNAAFSELFEVRFLGSMEVRNDRGNYNSVKVYDHNLHYCKKWVYISVLELKEICTL